MSNRVFPQLDDNGRGMTDEFYASLQIYTSLMTNPYYIGEYRKSDSMDKKLPFADKMMIEAIQLGKKFCSKFNQTEE